MGWNKSYKKIIIKHLKLLGTALSNQSEGWKVGSFKFCCSARFTFSWTKAILQYWRGIRHLILLLIRQFTHHHHFWTLLNNILMDIIELVLNSILRISHEKIKIKFFMIAIPYRTAAESYIETNQKHFLSYREPKNVGMESWNLTWHE